MQNKVEELRDLKQRKEKIKSGLKVKKGFLNQKPMFKMVRIGSIK